jgi:hypothetical protein
MTMTPRGSRKALAELQRALTRRRLSQLEPALRFELAAFLVLVAGFVGWQSRLPLDALTRARGTTATLAAVALLLLALALAGGALAAARHAMRLKDGPGGPEWLALPIAPEALASHLAWASRQWRWWMAVPAVGVLTSAIGLAPGPALVGVALGFVLALGLFARIGCALVLRSTSGGRSRGGTPESLQSPWPPPWRQLAVASRHIHRRALPVPRPRIPGALRTLVWKDLLLAMRPTRVREGVLVALALSALAVLAWLPTGAGAARIGGAALSLLAAATLAGTLIAASACDPYALMRGLPLSAQTMWSARLIPAAVFVLALGALEIVAAGRAGGIGVAASVAMITVAALGIVTLGANYAVTLFGRAEFARHMLGLTLALSLAGSLMMPLLGWFVLGAALIHSARRLPRWSRLEPAEC